MTIRPLPVLGIVGLAGLLVVGFFLLRFYFVGALLGYFSVPDHFRASFTAPNGGVVELRGTVEESWRSYAVSWDGFYRLPHSSVSERIGSWWDRQEDAAAVYASGDVIVLVPDAERLFVRTRRGAWKTFETWAPINWEWQNKSIHAGDLRKALAGCGFTGQPSFGRTALRYYSPASHEVVADLLTDTSALRGRMYFQLSEDGEQLDLKQLQCLPIP